MMQTHPVRFEYRKRMLTSHRLSVAQRYMLWRSHPRRIIFDLIGSSWAVYFLWQNNWQAALGSVLVSAVLGFYFSRTANPELLANTTLGKILLLHLHPANLAIQVVSLPILIYGIWSHSAQLTLSGISILLLGHFFGWENVDQRLRTN